RRYALFRGVGRLCGTVTAGDTLRSPWRSSNRSASENRRSIWKRWPTSLGEVRISAAQVAQLQQNLVRSHSAGVGTPLPRDAVRGMMLLRAAVLATGRSGARPVCCQRLCELLNAGVHPVIPARGSVGASGDLAPLAHLALGMIGEGDAEHRGEILPAREALRRAGLAPLVLEAKEGLTLLNGTQH